MKLDTIICGDNVEVLSGFPPACIDLCVTSPPYDSLRTYGGHSWDFEGVAAQLVRVIKPGGVIVWVVADATVNGSETGTSMRQALRFMELGLFLHDTMIYQKQGVGACGSNLGYFQQWEYAFVLSKGRPTTFNPIRDIKNSTAGTFRKMAPKSAKLGTRTNRENIMVAEFGIRTNVWQYHCGICSQDDRNQHTAPFPESLAGDHIRSWSNEGDIVLDPFAGSFTTCKAAKILQRRWIGIEVNPDYCEIGRKRLAQGVLDFTE